MKKILFIPLPAHGHINPTFKIAKILQEKGYRVAYMVDPTMKKLIEEQGFEIIIGPTFLFASFEAMGVIDFAHKNIFERLIDRLSNRMLRVLQKNLVVYEENIRRFAPDHIFLDIFLSYNYLLLKTKKPTTIIQTTVSAYQDALIPPVNSSLQSRNTFRIKLEWIKYKISRRLKTLILFGDSGLGLTKRLLEKRDTKLDYSSLSWNKSYQVGITNIFEWVLSPTEFDFPKQKPLKFQHHIGPTIDMNRIEIQSTHFNSLIDCLDNRKIAYCSLGTLSVSHNKNAIEFLRKTVEVFSAKKDWELIISCGQVDVNMLGIVSPNIHLFTRVPQLTMIRRSDLVITHGGHNTVIECILLESPVLVFPLNSQSDQKGMAARVLYHKIGLSGDINKITTAELASKVEMMINTPLFKENVVKMSRIFNEKNDNLEKVLTDLNF